MAAVTEDCLALSRFLPNSSSHGLPGTTTLSAPTRATSPNLSRNALAVNLHLALVTGVGHVPETLPSNDVQPGSHPPQTSGRGSILLLEEYRGYSRPIRLTDIETARAEPLLRALIMTYFQESVGYCFDSALVSMGAPIRDWVYEFIEKKGISRGEIPARFEDVIKTLLDRLGTSARVIAYRTMIQLYQQFGIAQDFAYEESLIDRFNLLKDRVMTDRLYPKMVRNPY